MIYNSIEMEENAVILTAERMCAAARTAPKAKGRDNIETIVLTGEEKDALADKMDEIVERENDERLQFFKRDANNVRNAMAVVLIGARKANARLSFCSYCGFESCAACAEVNGRCAFNMIDLGIAIGSAVAIAADDRVDNRVLYTAGKAAAEMEYGGDGIVWIAIPLSVKAKNIFFDRK